MDTIGSHKSSENILEELANVREELEATPVLPRTVEGKLIIDYDDLSEADLSTNEVNIKAYEKMSPEQLAETDNAFDELELLLKRRPPNEHLSKVVSL